MKKLFTVVAIILAILAACTSALAVGEIGATPTDTIDPSKIEGYWDVAYTSIAPLGFGPTQTFKKAWGVWDSTDPYAWANVNLQLKKLGQSKAATQLRKLPILGVYAVSDDGKRVRVDADSVQNVLDDLTAKVVRVFQSPSSFKLNGKKVKGSRTLYACNIESLTKKHVLRYVLILPDGQELGVYTRPWTKKDQVVALDGLVWVLTTPKKSSGSGSGSKPTPPQDPGTGTGTGTGFRPAAPAPVQPGTGTGFRPAVPAPQGTGSGTGTGFRPAGNPPSGSDTQTDSDWDI